MQEELLESIAIFFKWVVGCVGIGGVFTIAFINLIRILGFEIQKGKAAACWIYITLFVYGFCILLELFAC